MYITQNIHINQMKFKALNNILYNIVFFLKLIILNYTFVFSYIIVGMCCQLQKLLQYEFNGFRSVGILNINMSVDISY